MTDHEQKKNPTLSIYNPDNFEEIANVGYALSSVDRVRILHALIYQPKNVATLSEELHIPVSSLTRYLADLERANLISVLYQPSVKGKTKFFTLKVHSLKLVSKDMIKEDPPSKKFVVEMPIGMFSSCDVEAPCGMCSNYMPLEWMSSPEAFWHPQRLEAGLLWFNLGKIGYDFPLPVVNKEEEESISSISFSFEISSEIANYNNEWPSDISIWINDMRILTFVSPGDFGGTRGRYTPNFWPINCSQYGILKNIKISNEGIFLDNILIKNNVSLQDLHLENSKSLRFSIGVQREAVHKGGLNLFGKNFGDYNQGIVMTAKISTPTSSDED